MIKEIENRLERGYTNSIYGTSANTHEQMTNDIKSLLEIICNTRCSTQLNGKKVMPFDDWIELKKYTQLTPNLYKKGLTYINHEGLFKQYKKEQCI